MRYRVQQNHLRFLSKEEYWIPKKLTRWSKNAYNHTLWLMKEEWNKKKAKLQKKFDKQGIKTDTKMMKLKKKRKYYLRNFMSQAVNEIIKQCKITNIGTIVIGEMKNIKKNCRLGKKTTQNFHYITYSLFKQKLMTKSDFHGINYKEVDEAYTS